MAVVGIWVMLLPLTIPEGSDPIVSRSHQGAALWWLGTAILFAAVIESWSRDRNPLIFAAGVSAVLFGLLGASYTLAHDNVPLLVILIVGAFYSLMFGMIGVFLARVIRRIRAFLSRKSGFHRDDGDPDA